MSCRSRPLGPVALDGDSGGVENDGAKIHTFSDMAKKIVGHSGDGGGGALPARGITALPPMAVGPSPDHPRTTLGPSPDQELLMR